MNEQKANGKLSFGELFKDCLTTVDERVVFNMLIGGMWVPSSSSKVIEVNSPIDGSLVACVQAGTKKDVDNAVKAAHEARGRIREIPAIDRIDMLNKARHIMRDNYDVFVRTLVMESGKTVAQAQAEVNSAMNRIKMTMEEARSIFGEYVPGDWSEDTMAKFALVIREPIGVIACVSPFNYPLFSMVAKVIPAIVSGNAVVMKPSTDDPIQAILLARVLQQSGLPPGVVNVITGRGGEVGDELVSHELVGMVTLTGSTETGRHVASLTGMKKVHLELGGKGAAIVTRSADLSLAGRKVLEGCFKYSGQRCDAISRVLVEKDVKGQFLGELLKEYDNWKVGNPWDKTVNMGPLINERAAERVQSLVNDAIEKGAVLVRGGKHRGTYFEPTVLDSVPLQARIAWEETFGPVVAIIDVSDVDEAIEVVNRSRYGLDSCVFTNDFYVAWKVAKGLQEGSITVNDAPSHGVGYFPFGGNKDSGIGREGVGYSIDEMTRIKTISFNLAPAGLGKTRKIQRM
jgi:acyl-CoA reductase-like NAD-dependent aldehyde dehydrogenase